MHINSITPIPGSAGLPKGVSSDRNRYAIPLVEETSRKVFQRLVAQSDGRLSGTVITGLSITESAASLSRQILRLSPVGPKHPSIDGLGVVSSGISLMLASAVTLRNGISELMRSEQIGDAEGLRRAGMQTLSGAILTNASVLWFGSEAGLPPIPAMGFTLDALTGIGSILSIGIAGWGIVRSSVFRSRINEILEKKGPTEKEKVVETLKFLKEKVSPTRQEREAINAEVEALHPGWSALLKNAIVEKKLLNLAEVKINYLSRRIGETAVERIIKEVDTHLDLCGEGCKDDLIAAKKLINAVLHENKKTIFIMAIVAMASVIALTALILGALFSFETLPVVLYAITSAISLAMLLYPIISRQLGGDKVKSAKKMAVAMLPLNTIEGDARSISF